MSPTLTDLTIHAALAGCEEKFGRAVEQHWAGGGGKGGNIRPASAITFEEAASRVAQGIFDGGGGPEDLDRAAAVIAAGAPDDSIAVRFSRALRSVAQESREAVTTLEMWTAEREMSDMNTNTMEAFLRERGVPMLEQTTAVRNQDSPGQHPRQRGWMNYPTNVRPQAVDDREARGARPGDLPLSARILDAAREMAQLANAAKDTRQHNRIAKYASYLRQAYARQLEREDASEVTAADDDANAEMDKIVNDAARDAANRSGDGDHAEFRSFDDWDNEDRQGSEDRTIDDVDAQRRAAADDMALDEDLPRVPAPGRRYAGEDQLGDPAAGADEPAGARKNRSDDDVLQRVRKGTAKFGSGQPRGGDRYGGERSRYSAFGRESLREWGDLTQVLLNDLDLWYRSGLSWY